MINETKTNKLDEFRVRMSDLMFNSQPILRPIEIIEVNLLLLELGIGDYFVWPMDNLVSIAEGGEYLRLYIEGGV